MNYKNTKTDKKDANQLIIDDYIKRTGLENTKVLHLFDIINMEGIQVIPFAQLEQTETKGLPIISAMLDEEGYIYEYHDWLQLNENKKKHCEKIVIYFDEPQYSHTLTVGGTGFGKTTGILYLMLSSLSSQRNKPDLYISSCKSDIRDNMNEVEKKGYKTYLIDCANPLESNTIDIFYPIFLYEEERKKLLNGGEKKYGKPDKMQYTLQNLDYEYRNGYFYCVENKAFAKKQQLDTYIKSRLRNIEADEYSFFADIASYAVPTEEDSKNGKHFTDSAQQVLIGGMFFMLEKYREPNSGFNWKMFNLMNLNRFIQELRKQMNTTSRYSNKQLPLLKGCKLSEEILNPYIHDAEQTRRNYFSVLDAQLRKLCNEHVYELSMGGEAINLNNIDKPIAIFVRTREYTTADETFASMLVEIVYKMWSIQREMVGKENGFSTARPVHFLLDEFGNTAPILNFAEKLTVARSNRLYYHIFLQSYEQVESKYAKHATIFNNMRHIFMGSSAVSAKQRFSEQCGKKTVLASLDSFVNANIVNNSLITVPAVSASAIEQLPLYSAYMKTHNHVFRVSTIPSYYDNDFGKNEEGKGKSIYRLDSIDEYIYEIKTTEDDDDDDDLF